MSIRLDLIKVILTLSCEWLYIYFGRIVSSLLLVFLIFLVSPDFFLSFFACYLLSYFDNLLEFTSPSVLVMIKFNFCNFFILLSFSLKVHHTFLIAAVIRKILIGKHTTCSANCRSSKKTWLTMWSNSTSFALRRISSNLGRFNLFLDKFIKWLLQKILWHYVGPLQQ